MGDGEGMGLGEDPGKWPGKAHTSRNRQKNQVITDRSQNHEGTHFQVEITNVLEILIQFTIRGP